MDLMLSAIVEGRLFLVDADEDERDNSLYFL